MSSNSQPKSNLESVNQKLLRLAGSTAGMGTPSGFVAAMQHRFDRELQVEQSRSSEMLVVAVLAAVMHFGVTIVYARRESTFGLIDYWIHFQTSILMASAAIELLALVTWRFGSTKFLCGIGCYLSGLILVGAFLLGIAWPEFQKHQARERIAVLFSAKNYVVYDSPHWDPARTDTMPADEAITAELKVLNDAGFDGLVTSASLHSVPQIAKNLKFRSVIVGIGDPETPMTIKPTEQLALAEKVAKYVDGYCVLGSVSNSISLTELSQWMTELRSKTGKPVTTSFPVDNYVGIRSQSVHKMCDWHMPDLKLCSSRSARSVGDTYDELQSKLRTIGDIPADKGVLALLSYPSGPSESSYCELDQGAFARLVSRHRLPFQTKICWKSAFDLKWKGTRSPEEFPRQEEFVGLWRADLSEKPAVKALGITRPQPLLRSKNMPAARPKTRGVQL